MLEDALTELPAWAAGTGLLLAAAVVAVIVHAVVYFAAARMTARNRTGIDDSLVRRSRRPARWVVATLAVVALIPAAGLDPALAAGIRQTLVIALILAVGWLGISVTWCLEDFADERYRLDVADNLRARRVHTQVGMVRRILVVVIVVIVLCLVLMSIPRVREIGLSLFASAGVAGLVIGMAARPALSNLIAGVQIAFTGPINIDDVVIVEGEWGRVEEIGSTYVVIRIWDERRLVVPLSQFIEKPFQNWTRTRAEILGTVYLHADYSVPVEAMRARLRDLVESSDLWDGRVCGLVVTGATERTVELRALISASDASKAWDLRCFVREELIRFLQTEHPEALPKVRAEMETTSPSRGA